MYIKYKNSNLHNNIWNESLERYKTRPLSNLMFFQQIYLRIRAEAIRDKDSRWKIPADESKLSVKEHLELLRIAIESKKPVVIACNPAVMGIESNR